MDIQNYISSGIIEMYVIGLCSAEERTEMEALRLKYPELDEAVVKFETALENNLLSSATLPGNAVDEKVLQSLRSLQTPLAAVNTPVVKVVKLNRLRAVAAAAILLLLASSVANYVLYQKTNEQQSLIQKSNASPLPLSDYIILREPAITPVAMYGVAPYTLCRCTMFWDKKTGRAYIMIHHLPPSSPDNSYQLWAVVNEKTVSVGVINDKIRDRFIEVQNVPENATVFSVTLEKKGGSSSPTVSETYVSGKI